MRIAELSRCSGVTIPTIKYYLREGLLPAGTPTGRNQAAYGEPHLQRLRLIRALREVGGLSVAGSQEVLAVLDEPNRTAHELMGQAHCAIRQRHRSDQRPPAEADDPQWQVARAEAADRVAALGWRVHPSAPALDQLADVILAARRVDRADLLDRLPDYAAAAKAVAEPEVASAAAIGDPAAIMTAVVTGTVLGEALLSSLRLLAHEHISGSRDPG